MSLLGIVSLFHPALFPLHEYLVQSSKNTNKQQPECWTARWRKCLFLKQRRDPLALNIACSSISIQLSMFSVSRCFATPTSFRKSFEEMEFLFKFNHINFKKKWNGTFWYSFPVSARWSCSQCCNAWTVDLRSWNTNRHHARQTEDTFTRFSGSTEILKH